MPTQEEEQLHQDLQRTLLQLRQLQDQVSQPQSAPSHPAAPVQPAPTAPVRPAPAPASTAGAPKKKTIPPNRRKQLSSFRRAFLRLTKDGTFPPDRQNSLYQACQKVYLDWNEARQYVQPEALRVYQRYVSGIVAKRPLTEHDFNDIRKLQARLGLNDKAQPVADTTITRVLWRRRPVFAVPTLAMLLLLVVSGIALGFGVAFVLGIV